MKRTSIKIAIGLVLAAGSAQAAGPLYLTEGDAPQPIRWDMSNGPIPVYTDGGGAFTYDFDGVTPFITIERANEITQFAFDQWNAVETSTFEAKVVGTIESVTGIADVTGANAHEIYGVENGYGFFVNYDTDGSIVEDFFGASKETLLGVAFPEWYDEINGEITEATAVINGWNVYATDADGSRVAGVFTHEFGHAINLSHSEVNGDIFSNPQYRHAGPRRCETPDPDAYEQIETMFPFVSHGTDLGKAMSTVNLTDDKVAISNIYPTPEYAASFGSITGVVTLKDGKTPYSGINVIARNVNDWFYDAVSAQSGDQTQGQVGPDGRFTINGLTPGEKYVIYINGISGGGYPTTPTRLLSEGEYWNVAESNDPATDASCDATAIVAEAGVTKTADIVFNGYLDGVQYTPIVAAYLTDMAKNGKSSAGILGSTAFKWDENKDLIILNPDVIKGDFVKINRNGQVMTVQADFDGDGLQQAALFDWQGSKDGRLVNLGDLNGETCGTDGPSGRNSSIALDVDAAGHTVVGYAYIDVDGDGVCNSQFKGEIRPFIWTEGKKGGMRMLSDEGAPNGARYLRADIVSGNGKVILGQNGGSSAVAWVEEGPLVNLYGGPHKVREALAVNYDGTRVALSTYSDGPLLWNPYEDEYTDIGSLEWCTDLPFVDFRLGNLCEPNRFCPDGCTNDNIANDLRVGPVSVLPLDMNDEGTVIVGRAGNFFSGVVGAMYVEGMGWMTLKDFFWRQGVAEAFDFPMDNPISISAAGDKIVGGLAGSAFSWHADLTQVYVCRDGRDIATSFPQGAVQHLQKGAVLGRCAFID
jgi:hypothetical protein